MEGLTKTLLFLVIVAASISCIFSTSTCPLPQYYCPATSSCVNNTVACCPSNFYYCSATSSCINSTLVCSPPSCSPNKYCPTLNQCINNGDYCPPCADNTTFCGFTRGCQIPSNPPSCGPRVNPCPVNYVFNVPLLSCVATQCNNDQEYCTPLSKCVAKGACVAPRTSKVVETIAAGSYVSYTINTVGYYDYVVVAESENAAYLAGSAYTYNADLSKFQLTGMAVALGDYVATQSYVYVNPYPGSGTEFTTLAFFQSPLSPLQWLLVYILAPIGGAILLCIIIVTIICCCCCCGGKKDPTNYMVVKNESQPIANNKTVYGGQAQAQGPQRSFNYV